jgi:hypothetical protein
MQFGVTVAMCNAKINEHAENCGNIHMLIAELTVDGIECSDAQALMNNIAITNQKEVLGRERQQIRKWRLYRDVLENVEYDPKQPITEHDIQNAKQYPIEDLIGRDIELRKINGRYYANCPFHSEDTPSFYIRNNFYYCFGCGASGDTIKWLQEYRGMGFIDAVKHLVDN